MPQGSSVVIDGDYQTRDAEADGSFTPGDLLEYNSANRGSLVAHATAAGVALPIIARPRPHGDEDDGTEPIERAYSDGEFAYAALLMRGCEFRPRIAANEDISVGDALVSNGDGTLREFDGGGGDGEGAIVAVALEANTDTSVFRVAAEAR